MHGFARRRTRANNRVAERWLDGAPDAAQVRAYSSNFGDDVAFDRPGQITDFIKSAAYKEGDVIWVQVEGGERLARIVGLGAERDRFDFRRLVIYVQLATKDGRWSLVRRRTWPGFIQRAYAAQGDALAISETSTKD